MRDANEQSCQWLFPPHLDKNILDLKRRCIKLDYTNAAGEVSFPRPLSRAHAARCKAQVTTTAVQHFHCTVSRKDMQKLTHLTEDEPTSKVHARMTQPTIIFAKPR